MLVVMLSESLIVYNASAALTVVWERANIGVRARASTPRPGS